MRAFAARAKPRLLAALVATCSALAVAPAFAQVTQERLENTGSEPQNWLLPYGNYAGWNYSGLDGINADNVGELGVVATIRLGGAENAWSPELHPIVVDGQMYLNDGLGVAYAIDLSDPASPQLQWTVTPDIDFDFDFRSAELSRGGVVSGAYYYEAVPDGYLAVITPFGEFAAYVAIGGEGEAFSAAPLPVENMILLGQASATGVRGWVAAFDEGGGELWRTYTIPSPGEPGNETWLDPYEAWRTGGGGITRTGTYDPETRTTFWGTGGPMPVFDPYFRPGDNLFTDTVLALDVDDGAIVWYFQYLPNDSFGFDETGVHPLIEAEIDGGLRDMVSHFSSNGHYYRIDAHDGSFIGAQPWIDDITWTLGIDPKVGRPVEYDYGQAIQQYSAPVPEDPFQLLCPTSFGGRWQASAYDPQRLLQFATGLDFLQHPQWAEHGPFLEAIGPANATLVAVDPASGVVVAQTNLGDMEPSGLLATASGLVFHGGSDGQLAALDAQTLDTLWSFRTGGPTGSPIAFAVDGKEYIAVVSGVGRPTSDERPPTPPVLYIFGEVAPCDVATAYPDAPVNVFVLEDFAEGSSTELTQIRQQLAYLVQLDTLFRNGQRDLDFDVHLLTQRDQQCSVEDGETQVASTLAPGNSAVFIQQNVYAEEDQILLRSYVSFGRAGGFDPALVPEALATTAEHSEFRELMPTQRVTFPPRLLTTDDLRMFSEDFADALWLYGEASESSTRILQLDLATDDSIRFRVVTIGDDGWMQIDGTAFGHPELAGWLHAAPDLQERFRAIFPELELMSGTIAYANYLSNGERRAAVIADDLLAGFSAVAADGPPAEAPAAGYAAALRAALAFDPQTDLASRLPQQLADLYHAAQRLPQDGELRSILGMARLAVCCRVIAPPESDARAVQTVELAGALNDFLGAVAIDPGNWHAVTNAAIAYDLIGVSLYPLAPEAPAGASAGFAAAYQEALALLPPDFDELLRRETEMWELLSILRPTAP